LILSAGATLLPVLQTFSIAQAQAIASAPSQMQTQPVPQAQIAAPIPPLNQQEIDNIEAIVSAQVTLMMKFLPYGSVVSYQHKGYVITGEYVQRTEFKGSELFRLRFIKAEVTSDQTTGQFKVISRGDGPASITNPPASTTPPGSNSGNGPGANSAHGSKAAPGSGPGIGPAGILTGAIGAGITAGVLNAAVNGAYLTLIYTPSVEKSLKAAQRALAESIKQRELVNHSIKDSQLENQTLTKQILADSKASLERLNRIRPTSIFPSQNSTAERPNFFGPAPIASLSESMRPVATKSLPPPGLTPNSSPSQNGSPTRLATSLGHGIANLGSDANPRPAIECGSIIQVDTLVLGESIPIIGSQMRLYYFTNRMLGYRPTFHFKADSNSLSNLNSSSSSSSSPNSNASSSSNANLIGKASEYWPLSLGLGGWTLSENHFFDVSGNRIYLGNGEIRPVQNPIHIANQLLIPNTDETKLFVFDDNGYHRETRHGLTGEVLQRFEYNPQGQLTTIIDAFNNRTVIDRASIDRSSLVQRSTAGSATTSGPATSSTLVAHRLIFKAPFEKNTELNIDSSGYLQSVTDPIGRQYRMTYLAGGLLNSFQQPNGQVSHFDYDNFGYLQKDQSSSGSSLLLESSIKNPATGEIQIQTHTAEGRTKKYDLKRDIYDNYVRSEVAPDKNETKIEYNEKLRLMTLKTPFLEQTIRRSADPQLAADFNSSVLTRITYQGLESYPQNWAVFKNITGGSFSVASTNGVPVLTGSANASATRDASSSGYRGANRDTYQDRNSDQHRASDQHRLFDLFKFAGTETVTNYNGKRTSEVYNANRRETVITSPMGRITRKTIDAAGNLIRHQVGNFIPTRFKYNPNGTLANTSIDERVTEFAYDGEGNLTSMQNPLKQADLFGYDKIGRVTSRQRADGSQIRFDYDTNDLGSTLTVESNKPHTLATNYFGFLSSYLLPSIGQKKYVEYKYNRDAQLELISDEKGKRIEYIYDANSGHLKKLQTKTFAANFSYNQNGLISAIASDKQPRLQFEYLGDHLKSLEFVFNDKINGQAQTAQTQIGEIQYVYNKDLALDSIQVATYNTTGRGATGVTATGTDSQLSGSGSVAGLSLGAASKKMDQSMIDQTQIVHFKYDLDGLLTKAGDETLTYSPVAPVLDSSQLGKVNVIYKYDKFGALKSKTTNYLSQPVLSQTLIRDNLGRITTKTEQVGNLKPIELTYTYDLAGRLSTVSKGESLLRKYNYDKNGNRLSLQSQDGSIIGNSNLEDQLFEYGSYRFFYDTEGHLKQKFNRALSSTNPTNPATPINAADSNSSVAASRPIYSTEFNFDGLGYLESIRLNDKKSITQISYERDLLGHRVSKSINGELIQKFIYQSDLQIAAELDNEGHILSQFIYSNNSNIPSYMIRSGRVFKLVTDQIGSLRMVIDVESGSIAQQMEYDEFGQVLTDTHPGFQPFGFAGGVYDPDTHLVQFGARDYDPETGRWISKDPILFAGGDTNLYGYIANDPINFVDPNGKGPVIGGLICTALEGLATVGNAYSASKVASTDLGRNDGDHNNGATCKNGTGLNNDIDQLIATAQVQQQVQVSTLRNIVNYLMPNPWQAAFIALGCGAALLSPTP
jgi:RHS repeat-associated protein